MLLQYMMKLGYAYVPIQKYGKLWTPGEGLSRGTIFPELYYPYTPSERVRSYPR